ncbi:MAG: hypothetical protein A2X32_12820 [Elusimicrobia bacterium GWC2_64_44]|nr:MAG: hypothetical protein A2X32_12820 [Elusimicrobia bacterium GWC2_64_44]
MLIKNVGKIDRVIRLAAGAALGYFAYTGSGTAAVIMGVAAAGAIVTGLVGFCGVYKLFGINTCSVD